MIFSTRIITMILLVQALSFAADCKPSFSDNVIVRVFSQDNVLIQGAQVNVTYQLDATTKKGYFTATRTSNESGLAGFNIHNIEVLEGSVDCKVRISAQIDNSINSTTVTANAHSIPVDLYVQAYPLTIQVVDQDDRPLAGAQVFVQNRTGKDTGADGRVNFVVGAGLLRVLVKHDMGKIEQQITVDRPLFQSIGFSSYVLRIRAIDNDGNPLPATVEVGDQFYEAANGTLEVSKVVQAKPLVKVRYGGWERSVNADLSLQTDYTVVFDTVAPHLVGVKPVVNPGSNKLKLNIALSDDGRYASGIRPDGITVTYRYNAEEWQTARAYSIAEGQYGVELPAPKNSAVLFFRIDASDKDGNRASFEGQLNVDNTIPVPANQTTNITGSVSPPAPGGFDLPVVAAGALAVLAVVIYLVYRFKISQGGGDGY